MPNIEDPRNASPPCCARRVALMIGLFAVLTPFGCANQWSDLGPPCPPQSERVRFSVWCDAYPESKIPPKPPMWAVNAGIGGYVDMELDIDRSGRVTRVRVVESLPLGVFDLAARESAQQLRFAPLTSEDPDYPSNAPYRITIVVREPLRR